MHITDKEKKAIYEAMKQIRENRRLQDQKGTKTKLGEGEIEEQTGLARPPLSILQPALALTKRSAPAGSYDLNFNPFDEVPQISASSPAPDLRRTDAYKDKAGNVHIGAPVTSLDNQTGFTITRNQYGDLDAVTGTGRSTKEFEAGMRDARRRNVGQAGMSRLKAAGLNLRDRMRGRPGRADMIGEQQSRPQSDRAPISTPEPGGFDLGAALADMSASLRTTQLGTRLDKRRVPGLTAREQRTKPRKAIPVVGEDGYVTYRFDQRMRRK